MTKPFIFLFLGLALPLSGGAYAASVSTSVFAQVIDSSNVTDTNGTGSVNETSQNNQTIDVDVDGPTGSDTVFVSRAAGQAKADLSYDTTTGVMRSQSQAQLVEGENFGYRNFTNANSNVRFFESFTAVGSGEVTFSLAVDGSWNTSPIYGDTTQSFWIGAGVAVFELGSARGERSDLMLRSLFGDPLISSTDQVLEATLSLIDGMTYELDSYLFTSTSNGLVDFSSTAVLDYETSGGVRLNFSSDAFLSQRNPQPPAVPLPAGAWFLLTALAGLVSMRRRASAR